jgi:hypothetical protein
MLRDFLNPACILSLVILLCKKQTGQFLANLTQPHNLFGIIEKNQPLNTDLSTDYVDKHSPGNKPMRLTPYIQSV